MARTYGYSCCDRTCGADDCMRCFPRMRVVDDGDGFFEGIEDENEEAISDAEASGLINDAIDRVFEASVKGGVL